MKLRRPPVPVTGPAVVRSRSALLPALFPAGAVPDILFPAAGARRSRRRTSAAVGSAGDRIAGSGVVHRGHDCPGMFRYIDELSGACSTRRLPRDDRPGGPDSDIRCPHSPRRHALLRLRSRRFTFGPTCVVGAGPASMAPARLPGAPTGRGSTRDVRWRRSGTPDLREVTRRGIFDISTGDR